MWSQRLRLKVSLAAAFCGILDRLETLDVSERQVDQETVAVVQPAELPSELMGRVRVVQ